MFCPKEVRPGRVTALDTMGLEQEIDWPLQQCHLESFTERSPKGISQPTLYHQIPIRAC